MKALSVGTSYDDVPNEVPAIMGSFILCDDAPNEYPCQGHNPALYPPPTPRGGCWA